MEKYLDVSIHEIAGNPPIGLFTLKSNIKASQATLDIDWNNSSVPTIEMIKKLMANGSKEAGFEISSKGILSLIHPKCPNCGSDYYRKNGTQKRKIMISFGPKINTRIQKYNCGSCGYNYKVGLSKIIPKYGHYSKDVRSLAVGFAGPRAISLQESIDLTSDVAGISISRETVRRWKLVEGKRSNDIIENTKINWSGIYSYDEQYVMLRSKKWYRYLLKDVRNDFAIADEIKPRISKELIREFFSKYLKDKPVNTIVTDGVRAYSPIIFSLYPNASHQKCVGHAMSNAIADFREAAGYSKGSSKPLPKPLNELYGKLWSLFLTSTSLKEAEDRFIKIYDNRFDYPYKARHRIEIIAENFVYLTEYLVTPYVPMTNNASESHFNRTYPDRIKKKFKTPEGLQAQISNIDLRKNLKHSTIDDDTKEVITSDIHEFRSVLSDIYGMLSSLMAIPTNEY